MILVTGAAGKTGLAVLHALKARGLDARALIRRSEQKDLVIRAGAKQVAVADLEDAAALRVTLEGASALYLIIPNVHPHEFEMATTVIEAAKTAGVSRLVYHSVMLPKIKAMPHHWQKWQVEESLPASRMDYTILQPASYMQNILAYWPNIVNEGRLALPHSPDAVFSPVDLEDVAEASARVLSEAGHSGATYELAGPERLSSRDMALAVSHLLGRQISVEQIQIEDWKRSLDSGSLSAYAGEALSRMFAYYDQYGFAGDPSELRRLLKRPATNFTEFLKRNTS